MRSFSTSILVALTLVAGACGKKADGGGGSGSASASGTAAASGSDPGSAKPTPPTPPPVDPNADHVLVRGHHVPPKDSDPVVLTIPKFKVVKASFDPAKIEGGTAELELDLSSLTSGLAKRDAHLTGPDMLDVAKFATADIKIDNVKKTGDKTYSADATVNVHGVEKKLPVTFDVLDTTADSIRIKGTAKFVRFDYGIGKQGDGVPIADDQEIEIQLTLKKT